MADRVLWPDTNVTRRTARFMALVRTAAQKGGHQRLTCPGTNSLQLPKLSCMRKPLSAACVGSSAHARWRAWWRALGAPPTPAGELAGPPTVPPTAYGDVRVSASLRACSLDCGC